MYNEKTGWFIMADGGIKVQQKRDDPHHLITGKPDVWTDKDEKNEKKITLIPEFQEISADGGVAGLLPPKPRRLSARVGYAGWAQPPGGDLQNVLSELADIKRSLNDAQLLKDAILG